MALILPVLLFILFAIINIGLYMNAHLQVAFATHQGVRLGALTNDNGQIRGAIHNSLQNLQDYSARTNILIDPLSESSRNRGDDLKITVTYSYPMPIKFRLPFGITTPFFDRDSILVKSIAVAKIEYE
jgi:Flp pilus assembly protein TadG